MRVVSVVGARPQFIKLAPVSRAIAAHNARGNLVIEDIVVHTGQHYDALMSDIFFSELSMKKPDVNLTVGSGSHGAQTARMLERVETLLIESAPDITVVYGDTNSTIAAALASAKLQIPVAHVEAGLRSFNRAMPEEINRVATDHLSDVLFAPTQQAEANLRAENLGDRCVRVGDVMYDAVLFNRRLAREAAAQAGPQAGLASYALLTVHRAENTTPAALGPLLETINEASRRVPMVFPMHPRTAKVVSEAMPGWKPLDSLHVIEPVGYLEMLRLIDGSDMVITDSGGLQKEAFMLGCPCVTLRAETEWVESVESGANVLVGNDRAAVLEAVEGWLGKKENQMADIAKAAALEYGGGKASERIVEAIVEFVSERESGND